jgi:Domain of unknown function DUF11/PASTA domain/Divergent InlB B-repeat domain
MSTQPKISRRLGSIAGLALAVAGALVLSGSAPGAQAVAQTASLTTADLEITVTHEPEPAKAWDTVTWQISVFNHSQTSLAPNVSVTVDPPSAAEWVGGCAAPGNPTIDCWIGDIPPQATRTVTLSLRIRTTSGPLTATASSPAVDDPDTSNNTRSDEVSLLSRAEDLGIGVHGIPDPSLAGSELTIQAVVTNAGPDDAYSPPTGEGVQVDLALPPLIEVISVGSSLPSPNGTTFCANSYATDLHIRCRWSSIARDQSVAVDIKVKAPGSGTLAVSGSVSNGGYANDPDPSNNFVQSTITVLNGFMVTVGKPGNGSGTVTSDVPGINCGSTCSAPYAKGAVVTLTAVADGGSSFAGWTGDCAAYGTNPNCVITIGGPANVGANFNRITGPPPPPPPPPPTGPPPPPPPPPTGPPPPPPPPPPPAGPRPSYCLVPDVIGLTEAKAKKKITDAACSVGKLTRKYSTRRPKGRVLAQNPAASFVVNTGTKVKLTVSKGKTPKKKPKHRHT